MPIRGRYSPFNLTAFNQRLDHGLLLGRADDDHTQYLLINGTRAMTGSLNLGSFNITNVSDITTTGLGTFGQIIDNGSLVVNADNGTGIGVTLEGFASGPPPSFRGGFIEFWDRDSNSNAGFLFENNNGRLVFDTTTQDDGSDTGNAWISFINGSASFAGHTLTISSTGDLSASQIIVDITNTEALLVRRGGDGGDVFIVDTSNRGIGINVAPDDEAGIKLSKNGAASTSVKGIFNNITGTSSTPSFFGTQNLITINADNSVAYGTYNELLGQSSVTGETSYGTYNLITNGPGYGVYNDFTVGASGDNEGVHNEITNNQAGVLAIGVHTMIAGSAAGTTSVGGFTTVTLTNASAVGRGYTAQAILDNAGQQFYGFQATESTGTINNPTQTQAGFYVDWSYAGTDTGGKKWAFYNASTNTTSGKVFLGLDNTFTHWGTTITDLKIGSDGTNGVIECAASLITNAGRIVRTTRLTGTTTLDATHHNVFCDTDGGAFTITLPTSPSDGQTYRIINVGSGGNSLTIDENGNALLGSVSTFDLLDGDVLIITFETTEGWW